MIKRILFSIVLTLTALEAIAQSYATNEPSWVRDDDNHFSYYTWSEDGYRVNAQMQMFESKTKDGIKKGVDFRLIWSNKEYCKDYSNDTGVIYQPEVYVNAQAIKFNISCFNNEFVNLYPDGEEGLKHVLKSLKKASSKVATFVIRRVQDADIVYEIPTKGFRSFYKELEKATKAAI